MDQLQTNPHVETGNCPKLTVGILAVPQRLESDLQAIQDELLRQSVDLPVEILVFLDNQVNTVGAKRTLVAQWASGEYLTFVDDDDNISQNYVESILAASLSTPSPDCIVFDAWVTLNDDNGRPCRYGIEYEDVDYDEFYVRRPNHICGWKRNIVLREPFHDANCGEDAEWALRAAQHVKTQHRIDCMLYHYRWHVERTLTQRHMRGV